MDDIHGNLYAPRWYPQAWQHSMARDYLRRSNKPVNDISIKVALASLDRMLTDTDGKRTLATMDAAGINKRIVVILDFGLELGEAEASVEEINTEILEVCAKSGGRLVGFCGVDPRRPNARWLVDHAFKNQGAKGLKLHPTASWTLLDPECLAIVKIAADNGSPVLSHLGKTVDVLNSRNARPEDFIELARRFPSSQFIAGHCGFELWTTFIERQEIVPNNLFFDIGGWQELYEGNSVAQASALVRLCETFPGRICFGTDAPFYGYNFSIIEKRWKEFIQQTMVGQPVEWDSIKSKLYQGDSKKGKYE
jgi:predicted TIM-barrel fold metal-dependent hydrolase